VLARIIDRCEVSRIEILKQKENIILTSYVSCLNGKRQESIENQTSVCFGPFPQIQEAVHLITAGLTDLSPPTREEEPRKYSGASLLSRFLSYSSAFKSMAF